MSLFVFQIYTHMYLINWCYNNYVHSQSLLWGALSVVLSPVMSTKINSQILNFVLVNIMKSLGSRCIPFQVYTRFVACCVVMCTLCLLPRCCSTSSFQGWKSLISTCSLPFGQAAHKICLREPLPVGQVRLTSCLPGRKIYMYRYLSRTTGQHFFQTLVSLRARHWVKYQLWGRFYQPGVTI